MSAVILIFTGKTCDVSRMCRASVHRDLQPAQAEPSPRRRPGPQGSLSDADLAREIRQVITDSRFHGEGYRKCGRACATRVSAPHRRGFGAAHARERAVCEALPRASTRFPRP